MASAAFLQKAYLAYFGRPVDANGAISYAPASVTEAMVLSNFSSSAESKALYPTFGYAQVNAIYQMLFGRDAEIAGATYHLATVADGRQTPASMAMAILNGAQNADLATLNLKLAASAAFTAALDTTAEAVGYAGDAAAATARDFLKTVLTVAATSTATDAAVLAVTTPVAGPAANTSLTANQDSLKGTSGDDTFSGSIFDNANTLQSGDKIAGGTGNDRLVADVGNSQKFAITPETTGVEEVAIRAQAIAVDSNNNNMVNNSTSGQYSDSAATTGNQVQIDAERMVGVTQWESNNSRADVVIEDVRILSSQITKDITIAMVETDPGHVDMGVYFDQYSLKNSSSTSATLALQVMDTRSAAAGTAPLKDSPYNGFAFNYTAAGATAAKLITVTSPAIDAAQTYAELLTAVTAAVKLLPELATFTVALGDAFTVTDTLGAKQTGTTLVLTSTNGTVDSTGVGNGWLAAGAVPASSGLHTNMSTAVVASTALVTAKIILDDVGRGSTAGDLVVGGLSVGDTSSSQGVQRFEIEVRDNSKMESINSTNNTLREVTIKNGLTTSSSFAYVTTVKDKGNLTVNGNSGANGANITTGLATDAQTGENAPLPGSAAQTANGFGFSDVRLIDASAMTGKLAFSAEVTSASIAKYMTLNDIAAAKADNIDFIYTGGANDDALFVSLDSAVVSSRSTIVAGREDFTFTANGGLGNDTITVNVIDKLAGGAQAWYSNQKLNANITIDGGAGNDTIRTPGAGDAIILGGEGNDTVYTDNTGVLAVANATGFAGTAAQAYANAAATELSAALNAAVAANQTGYTFNSGVNTATATTSGQIAASLNVLNLVTPVDFPVAPITNASMQAATAAATASGALTFAQEIALNTAYGVTTGGVVTPAATLVNQAITGYTAVAGNLTAATFAAGNSLLDSYIVAAKSAAALATSNDANATTTLALLNTTQQAVVAANMAMNRVNDPVGPASGIVVTIGNYVEGNAGAAAVTETATFTAVDLVLGDTVVINGYTLTANGAVTAAAVAVALAGGVTTGMTATGTNNAAVYTVATGAGTNVIYTSAVAGTNVADLTNTGVAAAPINRMAVPVYLQGSAIVAAATESFTATISGSAVAGETVTFDLGSSSALAANSTTSAIAAAINAATNVTPNTWNSTVTGNVITVTAVTANSNVAGTQTAANFVSSVSTPATAGTQTTVNNLATLNAALTLGATDAAVVTALQAAIDNGAIAATGASSAASLLVAATVTLVGTVDAAELAAIALIMTPLQTAAGLLNTAAQATLTAASAADLAVVNAASTYVAGTPAGLAVTLATTYTGGSAADFVGATGTAAALAAANTALTTANAVLTPLNTQAANLAALKAAIAITTTDLQAFTATQIAVGNGSITAPDKTAIDTASGSSTPVVSGTVIAAEKTAVDLLLNALQLVNQTQVAHASLVVANASAIVTATATANTIALAASVSGGQSLVMAAPKAVYVFNTANQAASYNAVQNDERNLADLKSDANNTSNFYNATVKVSYKGIDASLVVAGSGFKTTDLQINQALKAMINGDAVLGKLLVATDGPANTLVVTSLTDGVHATADLAVSVTMPGLTVLNASDIVLAAAAYGLPVGTTEAALLAAMGTTKVAFDAKGDFATALAESGAAGANTNAMLTGGNSLSSSDNTVTGGAGNDVIVLSTTVGVDALTASNEKVVFAGSFGADTIVNFTSGAAVNADVLDFSAFKVSGANLGSVALDKSIVIGAPVATVAAALTAVQVAALFTDSVTAINHVYVAVDATNIGTIWQVADAAGVLAGNVTATVVGTIDLANTAWASMTAANFA